MKTRNINFGMLLIFLGTLFLLRNTGILNWSFFSSLEYLWPVILIIIGVSWIFNNNPIINGALWLGFLILIIAFSTIYKPIGHISVKESQYSSIEKFPETKYGDIKFQSGASKLNLTSEDKSLITLSSTDRSFICDTDYSNNKENVTIKVEHNPLKLNNTGDLNVKLNNSILWNLKFELGASTSSLDLSKNLFNKLDIEAGAVKLDLTLGKPNKNSDIKLQCGASTINLNIPKDTGIRIRYQGALSNNNLNTLGWKRSGDTFYSTNYDNVQSKYNVDLQMGLGSFYVHEY